MVVCGPACRWLAACPGAMIRHVMPRHLDERAAEFARADFHRYLLAVSEELRGSRDKPLSLPANVITYKSALAPAAIRAAIEALGQ